MVDINPNGFEAGYKEAWYKRDTEIAQLREQVAKLQGLLDEERGVCQLVAEERNDLLDENTNLQTMIYRIKTLVPKEDSGFDVTPETRLHSSCWHYAYNDVQQALSESEAI